MTLFGPQVHKIKRGYYIQHDTLMALDPSARQRAITYFIARNTPWKLDPQDRYLVEDQFKSNNLGMLTFVAIIGATAGAIFTRKLNLLATPLAASFAYNYVENRRERNYIMNSDLVMDLALKYNFSIFDFQNSKKESQLEMLKDMIEADVKSMANVD